jgi:hypothetical protein
MTICTERRTDILNIQVPRPRAAGALGLLHMAVINEEQQAIVDPGHHEDDDELEVLTRREPTAYVKPRNAVACGDHRRR